ncbi:uncharacterized protein L203_105924 [Cryptococcus depauperatus CBS 7841]|uniref:Rho guanyl-nucleotide exchange factor n=1 Tax=Cryptococcus depauperatus CBS 7841 TaxID=1295531 RepID=A0AAJ8JY81_9TREE
MPPLGPRLHEKNKPPQNSASAAYTPAENPNVRNQAFESIFGRPAGGHHPQMRPAYHYAPPPQSQRYLNPAQPSYPPPAPSAIPYPRPQHVYSVETGYGAGQLAEASQRRGLSPTPHPSNLESSPVHHPTATFPTPKPRATSGASNGGVIFPLRTSPPAQPSYPAMAGGSGLGNNSRMPTSNSITSFHKPTSSPSHSKRVADEARGSSDMPQIAQLSLSVETLPDNGRGTGGSDPELARQNTAAHRHGSASGMARASIHRRMTSDSSVVSFGSVGNAGEGGRIAPMSPIGSHFLREENVHGHASRRSMEGSTISLPLALENNQASYGHAQGYGQSYALPPGAAPASQPHSNGRHQVRSTSFSSSSASSKDGTIRASSIGSRMSGGLSSPVVAAIPHRDSHLSRHATHSRHSHSHLPAPTLNLLSSLPPIYPALLSLVSGAFKQVLPLGEFTKDGISYKDAFDGKTAVSVICELIKTSDRNLALFLGRAMDGQKFFHDVTYDHRLRDNAGEIYQFRERLATPWVDNAAASPSELVRQISEKRIPASGLGGGMRALTAARPLPDTVSLQSSISQTSFMPTPATSSTSLTHASSLSPSTSITTSHPQLSTDIDTDTIGFEDFVEEDENTLPVGVFTLLTDCYSPTCSRDSLCYSINCPRRLEQMKRLGVKPEGGLNRKLSRESLKDVKETGTLWIHSVSQEILDSVDDREKKRQEAINEVIYTERDFVRDLEYLRDQWVKPLRTTEIIDPKRRDDFVRQVFWNVHDVLAVNHPLAERLTKRQKKEPVVSRIGDLFLERVPLFEPFVAYGAHQLFGKYEFEKEKGNNLVFQKFVDETERKPESRKLELNGYLTKPTTRLGRYPLLLEAVLKYTPDNHQDKKDLPEVIKMIRGFLGKVNIESGKSENIFELAQIEQQLVFRPNETIDLRLRDKNRQLVHKGPLKRRGGSREEIADLLGFLFDHAFLLVKPKWVNKNEQYKVYRRPIPLELLVIAAPDEQFNSGKLSHSRARLVVRQSGGKSSIHSSSHNSTNTNNSNSNSVTAPPKPESKHGFSLTIVHLGKKGYSMQLWVDTYIGRKKWLENIDKQQAVLKEKSCVFISETITEGVLGGIRKVNCSSPYDQGNRMIFGTDEGVYFANLRDEKLREPVKVINLIDVTQVDVIEEFQVLIVLHERCVTTFPLDCLDPSDPNAALKRGKRISSHTSFIKSGVCLGKTLVAIVKSSTLSSTIKVMEPMDISQSRKKTQGGFMRRLNGRDDALKLFKEFYIPTESSSVHFLKTKLCVGCTKGFEIVDLETLDMQGLLDPSDGSLDFVLKRDNVRPIAIYRIEEDFLLCYDEFAFYVNKNGWRSRPKWAIVWEGLPSSFALQYPYVIAFEPTFIEVHHVETGHLVQIIPGSNIQCLFADTPPSRVNAPILPPNRMAVPPTSGTPYGHSPAHPGYPGYQPSSGYAPPHPQARGGYFPGPSGARPRPPLVGYGMPPPGSSLLHRFARPQVLFVSEDSHVQFLKFPSPPIHGNKTPSGPQFPQPESFHAQRSSR